MPHKRAKRSIRESERASKGSDNPPTGGDQDRISKRATWVLGAERVRSEFKERKRKREEDGEDRGKGKKKKTDDDAAETSLKIRPGESLPHFNRRIEDDLRSGVREAIKTSINSSKRKRRAVKAASPSPPPRAQSQAPPPKPRKTEFDSKPTQSRLNDVAQAPPNLTKLPRKATNTTAKTAPISDAQKRILEEERERVIKRYREMKEAKRIEAEEERKMKGPKLAAGKDEL